ncbi:MAG: D-glycero-beta-D-manno-heptose 1-phosphate adenylyltransferase [Bdellovibrionota bacterium]
MSSRALRSKIKATDALNTVLKKRGRKKCVFTNGCFDLIHPGHVTYLEQAKKLGDLLVVALNSDASVRRLKGKGRPINRLQDRAIVIAALESVDYVTWFSEDTPLRLILKLKPNLLVKGGDWDPSRMVGATEVLSWGGKVKSLAYLRGKSTSKILAKSKSK